MARHLFGGGGPLLFFSLYEGGIMPERQTQETFAYHGDVIKTARIEFGKPPAKACVYVIVKGKEEDGEHFLFDYYQDELTFSTEEFVGLTIAQAQSLFHKKDVACLRS